MNIHARYQMPLSDQSYHPSPCQLLLVFFFFLPPFDVRQRKPRRRRASAASWAMQYRFSIAAGHITPSQRSVNSPTTLPVFAPFLLVTDLGVFGEAFSAVFDLATRSDLAFFEDAYFPPTSQIYKVGPYRVDLQGYNNRLHYSLCMTNRTSRTSDWLSYKLLGQNKLRTKTMKQSLTRLQIYVRHFGDVFPAYDCCRFFFVLRWQPAPLQHQGTSPTGIDSVPARISAGTD